MADHVYPRSSRLIRPAEFTRVYREGRRLAVGYLQIVYRPNECEHPRLGLAIAKRVLPRAVDRNRAKRLSREHFRRHQMAIEGIDIVVSLRGRKQAELPDDFADLLESLWKRLPKG